MEKMTVLHIIFVCSSYLVVFSGDIFCYHCVLLNKFLKKNDSMIVFKVPRFN
jgi:hypothetical protein